jgi:carboxypeptidase C (cathepsin A)
MRISRPAAAVLSLLLLLAMPALAADEKPTAQPAAKPTAMPPPADSTTHHEITLGDKTLAYTATAGSLAIKDD